MALGMPDPTSLPLALIQYKVLSFDVYGTLIEYKSHILDSFQPLISRLSSSSPYRDPTPLSTTVSGAASKGSIEFLKLFQREEDKIKLEKPLPNFADILKRIWERVAAEIEVETTAEEASQFGSDENIASWPVFAGTIEALQKLSKHYRLVALSNIDQYAWDITKASPKGRLQDVSWWKTFTAEEFGEDLSRADDAKLETLMNFVVSNGIKKDEVLHVAQSLGHDHAPAKRQGISSVFLTGDGPKWGKEAESRMAVEKGLVGYAWRCSDLQEFAALVEEEFAGGS